MNTIRLLILALLACCLAPAAAAAPAAAPEQQLIGIWQDNQDPENIIQFLADHTVRIYIPKSEGQATNVHWIDGSWALSGGRALTMTLNMPANGGMSKVKKFTLSFSQGQLVVKSGGKVVGRQHRITEQTLQRHLW